jgi:CRP-like cAMP-binding protein
VQLSADELKSIQTWLSPIELRPNNVLQEQGAASGLVYFPLSGMISLLAVMQTGEAIETGIIGAEGLLGGDAPINGHLFANATVQLGGSALTMPETQFADAYHAHPILGLAATNTPHPEEPRSVHEIQEHLVLHPRGVTCY